MAPGTPHDPASGSSLLTDLIGHPVVLDLRSSFVCLGTLVGYDPLYYDVRDADLHDFRDGNATRELYVYDAVRLGIRRNRERVLVRRDEVVALARIADIAGD